MLTKAMTAMLLAWLSLCQAQVVLTCDFSPNTLGGMNLPKMKETDICEILRDTDGSYQLHMRIAEADSVAKVVSFPFDFSKHAGKLLHFSVWMRYEHVSKPALRWNGLKLMAEYRTVGTGMQYQNPHTGRYGTSDWVNVEHSFVVEGDSFPGIFELGMQDCSGEVWFKNFCVEIVPTEKVFPSYAADDYQCDYTERVTANKRRRGVMSPGKFTPRILTKDLPDLREWGGNLIRWQLCPNSDFSNNSRDPEVFVAWITERLPEIRQVLDKCQKLGIQVVLDLHAIPGGRTADGGMLLFEDAVWADTFERVWILLSATCKGHPALYGYDLLNEPSQNPRPVPFDYLGLQYRVAKRIRTIDPETPIIIESDHGADPFTYSYISPIPLPNIIYQVHTYYPGDYTHQRVLDKGSAFHAYPDAERGWTKEAHRAYLEPLVAWAKRHRAKIYVGEFSAARWAEGADIWLRDAIDMFEELGWDWSYHAFRESDTWSVEHTERYEESKLAPVETKRKKVLLDGLKQNEW